MGLTEIEEVVLEKRKCRIRDGADGEARDTAYVGATQDLGRVCLYHYFWYPIQHMHISISAYIKYEAIGYGWNGLKIINWANNSSICILKTWRIIFQTFSRTVNIFVHPNQLMLRFFTFMEKKNNLQLLKWHSVLYIQTPGNEKLWGFL